MIGIKQLRLEDIPDPNNLTEEVENNLDFQLTCKKNLTEKQLEVAKLLSEGRNQREAAKEIGISRSSLRDRIEGIKNKILSDVIERRLIGEPLG